MTEKWNVNFQTKQEKRNKREKIWIKYICKWKLYKEFSFVEFTSREKFCHSEIKIEYFLRRFSVLHVNPSVYIDNTTTIGDVQKVTAYNNIPFKFSQIFFENESQFLTFLPFLLLRVRLLDLSLR